MVKIAIDAGHGMHTPGKRTPDGEREWSFNNKVAVAAINKLETYENVQILRLDDPTGKRDVPLKERTDKANSWGADVLVSCHHNAHMGVWGSHGGVETYTQPGSQKASVEIAKVIQPRITKAMGLRDRGCKVANLHMTRESRMPAILTEGGFMDSTTDIETLRNEERLKAQGVAIADGLAAYFNLTGEVVQASKPKPTAPTPSKPSANQTTSIVDYLNANKINSSAENRKKLAVEYGVKNYDLSAAKNTELLNKMRAGKPVSKPKPTPKPKGKTLYLPKTAASWRVYPTNKAPVKANALATRLNPKKFGGLSYTIIENPQKDVYTIQTAQLGKVNIYAGPGTGAVIK